MHEKCMWSGFNKISFSNYYRYYYCYSYYMAQQAVPVWDAVLCFGSPLCPNAWHSAWHPVDTQKTFMEWMSIIWGREGSLPPTLLPSLALAPLPKTKQLVAKEPRHFSTAGSTPSRPWRRCPGCWRAPRLDVHHCVSGSLRSPNFSGLRFIYLSIYSSGEQRGCLKRGQDLGRGLYIFRASQSQRRHVTTRLL